MSYDQDHTVGVVGQDLPWQGLDVPGLGTLSFDFTDTVADG